MVDEPNVSPAIAHLGPMFDAPLLVSADRWDTFLHCVRSAIRHKDFEQVVFTSEESVESDRFWDNGSWLARNYRPYNVKDGVLGIPVRGALMDKLSYQFKSWATGYEYVRRAVERGMDDPQVNAIAFDIDSPGGSAAGCFELAGYINEQHGRKPMRAYANHLALSGAYAIATAADDIVVSPSGFTGSVGVVASHLDISQMLKDFGVKVTLVYAGKHKVEGNAYEELSEDARERMQSSVDKTYDRFVSTVAGNRNISYDDVRSTEALVFDPEDSIDVKFADSIAEHRIDVVEFAGKSDPNGDFAVTDKKPETKTATNKPDENQVDAAKIESDARAAERQRFADVHASDEHKGREALAAHLLATTDMSAEAVIKTLAAAPKATPAAAAAAVPGTERNHFTEAMNRAGSPEAGAGAETETDTLTPEAKASKVFETAGYAPVANTAH